MIPGRRQGGFTLIEALLALALFGLGVTILSQIMTNALLALTLTTDADDPVTEVRFVRQQVILESDLDEFEEGGEVDTLSYGEARWEAEVEPTQVSDLFKVILTIELEAPDSEEEFEPFVEELYLLRPTWSDAGERGELIEDARERLEELQSFRDWK